MPSTSHFTTSAPVADAQHPVFQQPLSVTRGEREQLNGHQGLVIWFTGLSGSGKSTLANALARQLHQQGRRCYVLDGDNVRQGLNQDLGFTPEDRAENIRRVAEVSRLMLDAGLIVLVAFISPYRRERDLARQCIGEARCVEVFVDAPLKVCEARDPKGLYRRARAGQVPLMTGIDSPYEAPQQPAVRLDTAQRSVEQALADLSAAVERLFTLPTPQPAPGA